MIEITYTEQFKGRREVEYQAENGDTENLRDACEQWLADNPEMKALRDVGVTVDVRPVGVNGWWRATTVCHGRRHECQHSLAGAAVKGLLDTKVPV